jgi:hypothetical protein
MRGRLLDEMRRSDEAANTRVDKLLADMRASLEVR